MLLLGNSLNSYISAFKKHSNSRKKIHYCPYCPYTTIYTSHLKDHVRIHTGERPFVCNICYKGFTEKQSLKRHAVTHISGISLNKRL